MTQATRRRSASVTLGMTALLAASLTGCATEEQADYQAVCINQQNVRVDDDLCDEDHDHGFYGGYGYYYYPIGAHYPSVGSGVSGGRVQVPSSSVAVKGGTKVSGGSVSRGITVTRGGFGGSAGGGARGGFSGG